MYAFTRLHMDQTAHREAEKLKPKQNGYLVEQRKSRRSQSLNRVGIK